MITRITLGPAPPPGKYSSGNRGTLSANAEHPAAPSRDTPAAPAPAALKKSLRVSALSVLLPTPEKSPQHSQKANCIRARFGLRPSQHASASPTLVSKAPAGVLTSVGPKGRSVLSN